MINYTLGYCFTPDLQNVLLLKKAGLNTYNGIGGKYEMHPKLIMSEKFRKYTGIYIPYHQWHEVEELYHGRDWMMKVYLTIHPLDIANIRSHSSVEDSDIVLAKVDFLKYVPLADNVLEHIETCHELFVNLA